MTEFTGERLVPGRVNEDLWAEHISRYAFAARHAEGARILDIGCGTGYGTAALAQHARYAVGIDVAADAVAYSRTTYPQTHLNFVPASATALPFQDGAFDLITAFEVIEHLEDWRGMLAEARRLLHPEGLFLVSTPNKAYYNESRGEEGPNPFHVHEFEYAEFDAALREFFPQTSVLLQDRVNAFVFYPSRHAAKESTRVDGSIESTAGAPQEAYFFFGLCSVQKIVPETSFVFVPRASNLLRERERHIHGLEQQLREKIAQYDGLAQAHDALEHHLEEQNQWGLGLDQELQSARTSHTGLQADFEERTRWALSLNANLEEYTQKLKECTWKLDTLMASRWVKLGYKLNLGPKLDTTKSEATTFDRTDGTTADKGE